MNKNMLNRFLGFSIRQSKIGKRSRRPKWLRLVALVVVFALFGAVAQAQQPGKFLRIGVLDSSTAAGSAVRLEAFWQEVRKLGWSEGKNITIEYRFSEGKGDHLPELAADLVRLKVDLIVVTGTNAALAAKRATTTIPIVMTGSADRLPVWRGREGTSRAFRD